MKYLYSPVRHDDRLVYDFAGDKVTVKYQRGYYTEESPIVNEEEANLEEMNPVDLEMEEVFVVEEELTDLFDFSAIPDGEVLVDEIETELPVNPILSARRVSGELELELLYYHGANASQAERFPEWKEVN